MRNATRISRYELTNLTVGPFEALDSIARIDTRWVQINQGENFPSWPLRCRCFGCMRPVDKNHWMVPVWLIHLAGETKPILMEFEPARTLALKSLGQGFFLEGINIYRTDVDQGLMELVGRRCLIQIDDKQQWIIRTEV